MKNIVLIGLSGCGKTTMAPLIAEALGMDVVDMDEEIVRTAGCSIAEIFASQGEQVFRDMETDCARRCGALTGTVISTGGGVVLREENMNALSQNGLVVFLDRSPREIAGEDLSDRPLVAEDVSRLYTLYEQRLPLYRRWAAVTVVNSGPVIQVAEQLIHQITEALSCEV